MNDLTESQNSMTSISDIANIRELHAQHGNNLIFVRINEDFWIAKREGSIMDLLAQTMLTRGQFDGIIKDLSRNVIDDAITEAYEGVKAYLDAIDRYSGPTIASTQSGVYLKTHHVEMCMIAAGKHVLADGTRVDGEELMVRRNE